MARSRRRKKEAARIAAHIENAEWRDVPEEESFTETQVPTEIVIRPASEDELADVLRLWEAAGVTPPSVSDSIEGLTRLIREPAALLLVATIDGQIVGSAVGGWDGWRGNIYRLAVAPEYRRGGIARRLVAEISGKLFAKGATRVSALVEHEHQWRWIFGTP